MVRIHSIVIAVSLAIAYPSIALAEDGPCGGGLELNGSEVILKQPIPAETPLSAETRTCVQAIAAAVTDRPFIRSMTVAARVTDEQRLDGQGLQIAKEVASVLIAAGVPERKISAVAPAVGHGQDPGVVLVYRERHNTERIARILGLSGSVEAGRARDLMRRAQTRQALVTHDYVQTYANSAALIRLADDSTLYLGPESLLRLGKVGLDDKLQRRVQIELAVGEVIAFAPPGRDIAVFEITTRTAVAGVRGTKFRMGTDGADGGDSRLETLKGAVAFSQPAAASAGSGAQPAASSVLVERGFGSLVQSGGAPTPPRPLLPAATITSPRLGEIDASRQLTWQAVSGAAAYRVKLARDAQFVGELKQWTESGTSATLDASLPSGKWFWRVQAVDGDGLIGFPSKIYAFEVRR